MSSRRSDVIMAIASGTLLALGFSPLDFYILPWFALVPLLAVLSGKTTGRAFMLGTLTGFIYFMGIVYWIFHSVYFYGHVNIILSLLVVILLCLYLGSYVGIFSALFNYLSGHSRVPSILMAPLLWVTLEFLRTYLLTGFPWAILGYSQYRFLPLIQIADITGVYGVSFLVVAMNGAILDVAVTWPRRVNKMPLFARWPMTVSLIVYSVIIIASISYGLWRLSEEDKEIQKIRASVIQGNIEQNKKWDVRFRKEIINTYRRLSIRASAESPDIIVWPETALPFIYGYKKDKQLERDFLSIQKKLRTHLLYGSVRIRNTKDGNIRLSNSAFLSSPEGEILAVYDKIHLVPYGEYIPLKKFFPFIDKLVVGIGDFVPGEEPLVMEAPFARIGPLICYEIIFPGLVRKFVNKGANVLITITNDAWFGRTSAPYQHFNMGVFRAIENRVPLIRAANTGISGFIDPKGRIKSKSEIFVEAVLTEDIPIGKRKSFYTRYGDIFAFLCIIITVLLIANTIYPEKGLSSSRGRI